MGIYQKTIRYCFFMGISLYLTFPFLIKGLTFPLQITTYGGGFLLILTHLKFLKRDALKAYNYRNLQKYLIVWGFIIFLAIFYPFLRGSNDFSYLINIFNVIKVVIRMVTLYLLACWYYKSNISNDDYFKLFIRINCLYVVFSLIFLFVPSLREKWSDILYTPAIKDSDAFDIAIYYTRFGLQGFSGFINTCFCVIASIFDIYLLEKRRVNGYPFRDNIISLFILLIGAMLYGRIGLILTGGITIVYLFYLIFIKKKIKVLIYFTLTLCLIVGSLSFYINSNPQVKIWFDWAYEPFINYFSGNDFESASSNRLKEMWEMPSVSTIIFGDGYYTDNKDDKYYMHTDVGYLRNLFFFGLLPVLMLLYSYYLTFKSIFPKKKLNQWNKIFVIALFIVGLIIEAKGEFVLTLSGLLTPLFFTKKIYG